MQKRIIPLLLLIVLMFCSCQAAQSDKQSENTTPVSIVVTTEATEPTETTEPMSTEEMYEKALEYFQSGDYASAKTLFEQLGEYEKSQDYYAAADFMLEVAGFYHYWQDNKSYIFEIGKNVKVMNNDYEITTFKTVSFETRRGEYRLVAEGDIGTYAFVKRGDTVKFFSYGITPTNRSTYDDYKELMRLPDDYKYPTEPTIGMTAEEVRKSTWGEPQKINTTITANHTTEQWCYSNYRYVYLEDGIVTSIQK